MILLWIIMIFLIFVPAWIIWTPRMKKLAVKICLCVVSSLVWLFAIYACSEYQNDEEIIQSMITRNQNYVDCIDKAQTTDAFSKCVVDNYTELNEIYGD